MITRPRRTLPSSSRGSAISRHPSRRFTRQDDPFYIPTAHSGTKRPEEPSHSPAITAGCGKTFTTGAPQAPPSTQRSSPSRRLFSGPVLKASQIPSSSSTTRPRSPPPLTPVYVAASWQASGSTASLWTAFHHLLPRPSRCATARHTLVSRATNGPTDSLNSAPP